MNRRFEAIRANRSILVKRTLRAQILKIFQSGLKISSQIEIFKRATHQPPIFCGEFWRSRLKFSSEIETSCLGSSSAHSMGEADPDWVERFRRSQIAIAAGAAEPVLHRRPISVNNSTWSTADISTDSQHSDQEEQAGPKAKAKAKAKAKGKASSRACSSKTES